MINWEEKVDDDSLSGYERNELREMAETICRQHPNMSLHREHPVGVLLRDDSGIFEVFLKVVE